MKQPRLADIVTTPTEELEELYGISIASDGVVWDEVDDSYYDSIVEWWNSTQDEGPPSSFMSMRSKQRYDDE